MMEMQNAANWALPVLTAIQIHQVTSHTCVLLHLCCKIHCQEPAQMASVLTTTAVCLLVAILICFRQAHSHLLSVPLSISLTKTQARFVRSPGAMSQRVVRQHALTLTLRPPESNPLNVVKLLLLM
jgi:hypothetical protein